MRKSAIVRGVVGSWGVGKHLLRSFEKGFESEGYDGVMVATIVGLGDGEGTRGLVAPEAALAPQASIGAFDVVA